jgi:hypothetical protein
MKTKTINSLREIRLWIGQIIGPAASFAGTIISTKQITDTIKEMFGEHKEAKEEVWALKKGGKEIYEKDMRKFEDYWKNARTNAEKDHLRNEWLM